MDGERIAVVHNGTDPVLDVAARKSTHPTICVVGRLVPHKQVEHAIDATLALRAELPDLTLHVVGSGLVGRTSCARTPRRGTPATRSCSRVTSTRCASRRSTSAPG